MNSNYELTWKRSVLERKDGEPASWVATDNREDPPVVYAVKRDPDAPPGRQWSLTVFTGLAPDRNKQTRAGFSLKSVAQAAALTTRCHLCGRHLPFATMDQSGGMDGWRCRNHDECLAVSAAKDAEARRVTAEIRNTPWTGVSIRDADDGPELVFQTDDQNSTVVRATEPDLIRLTIVLLERYGSLAQAALDENKQTRKGGPS